MLPFLLQAVVRYWQERGGEPGEGALPQEALFRSLPINRELKATKRRSKNIK